jgi:hypothetical protein
LKGLLAELAYQVDIHGFFVVHPRVFFSCHYDQIVDPIVFPISVDVMNHLVLTEFSIQVIFHNNPMLNVDFTIIYAGHILVRVCHTI